MITSPDALNPPLRVDHLPPYPLGAIAQAVMEARNDGKDVVDLSQVHPALPPPSRAVDKLVQAALLPHNHRYSSSQGLVKLREAFAAYYAKRFGVELDVHREIVTTFGIKEGLTHLLSAICSPGDTVVIPTPTYPVHTAGVMIAGGVFRGVPLFANWERAREKDFMLTGADDEFFLALEHTIADSWPRPRVLVLSFPHNPTGTTVDRSFFERIIDFALDHRLIALHDFAYGDIAFTDDRPVSLLSIPRAKETAVEFYSLSKGFNLPGWRVAFCAGSERLVTALKRMKSYLDFGIFQPIQFGAAEILKSGAEQVEEVSAIYRARRDLVVDGIRNLGWNVSPPRATPFLWAEPPEVPAAADALRLSYTLLQKESIAVCPGVGFDKHAGRYFRLSLIEPEHRLRTALERLGHVFPRIGSP